MTTEVGIVFDNDGLLLDTEPCWTRAQEKVFERYGRVFDLEAKQALVGTAPETATRVLERLLELPGLGAQASAEMYDLAVEEIAAGAEPRPGALQLLEALRGRWPLGIASNAPRRHLLTGLQRVGVKEAFDVVIGSRGRRGPEAGARPLSSRLRAARHRPGALGRARGLAAGRRRRARRGCWCSASRRSPASSWRPITSSTRSPIRSVLPAIEKALADHGSDGG